MKPQTRQPTSTVQTGQNDAAPHNAPYFHVAKEKGGYGWILWSANNRPLAMSGQTYPKLDELRQALNTTIDILTRDQVPEIIVNE